MGRWADIAQWRGPTPNQGGAMQEVRGVVLHIASGFYEGTIAWQKNRTASVSSHFVFGRDPSQAAQMIDTDVAAWTQIDGNGHWLSAENVGFTPGEQYYVQGWEKLTLWQIEKNAQLLAKAHKEYGVPLQIASKPSDRGLGHHSMGEENGANWGHPGCPGKAIIAQKPAIIARAKQIIGGSDMPLTAADVALLKKDLMPAIVEAIFDRTYASPAAGFDPPGKKFQDYSKMAGVAVRRLDEIVIPALKSIGDAVSADPFDEDAVVSGILTGLAAQPAEKAAAALKAVMTAEEVAALVVALQAP